MTVGRTLFFVPGNRPDRIAKAVARLTTGAADAVAVDLEDAVAEQAKDEARAAAVTALREVPPGLRVFLRVNALGTPWARADLDAAAGALAHLAGVVLPKAEGPEPVHEVDALLGGAEAAAGRPIGSTAVLPIIESARGVLAAPAVAAAPRVATLVFGTLHLAADLGVTPTAEGRELLHARSQVVLATAAAGLVGPLDGPHADLDDTEGLVRSSRLARELGFTGRVVVHPRQLDPVRTAFSATAAELARARAVLDAHAAAGGAGAFRMPDGTFVDRPVLLRAAALLGERIR